MLERKLLVCGMMQWVGRTYHIIIIEWKEGNLYNLKLLDNAAVHIHGLLQPS